MNRNDVVLPVTGGSDAVAKKTPIVSPRQSPRILDASSLGSYKRSPRQPPKSAGSTGGRPTFPKGALLEEKSVHLPMPSFHERNHCTLGWECAGCGSVNQSALSNECSVCGMLRSVDFDSFGDSDFSESMAGDEDVSFSSMMYDGNASEASLSHHNFSILDHHKAPEMVDRQLQRGHVSLPVLQSSSSSIASQRTTRTTLNHNHRRQGRSHSSTGGAPSMQDNDDDDTSVVSFRNWNGNIKVKPWECAACTFINENPLQHVVCEMCGHRRDEVPSTAAHIPLDQSTTEEEEDVELELLRTEQIRELIDLQRDIMSNFGNRNNNNNSWSSIHTGNHHEESKFNTSDLQREVAELQATITPRLDYNDIDGTEYEMERIKEVIKAQQEIMMDFKRKRDVEYPLEKKNASSVSGFLSPSSQKVSASADSLFGVSNQPNTTPNSYSLKGSMKAARGMLRQEDLVLPILWGDDLGKAEKKVGSGSSVASSRNSGSKR